MEELKPTISYNEWQKISIQREVKLLCQKFNYEFSQGKLDELLEIYKSETEGVYEFCCLYEYMRGQDHGYYFVSCGDLLPNTTRDELQSTCKLGSDTILYLYTQICQDWGWIDELVYCYNKALKYTLPF